MQETLSQSFDEFCTNNHVTLVRGNVFEAVKVNGYEHCIELLKTHPRCPIDTVAMKTSIEKEMSKIMAESTQRIVYTFFSYTTFGVNTNHLGQDMIWEIRKNNPTIS